LHSLLKISLGLLIISLVLTCALSGIYGFVSGGMLSPFGSALVFFFASMLLFLGGFGLEYYMLQWRLEWNTWVVDIQEMDFLFNPMYGAWLFYHDHKKWAKWNTIIGTPCAISIVTVFGAIFTFIPSLPSIAAETFWIGWIIATELTIIFALTWYLYYTSVDRTPSPYPRGRLRDLPRRL